jgi:dolichol kinase
MTKLIIQFSLILQLIGSLIILLLFQVFIGRIPFLNDNETKRRWQHAISGHLIVYTIQRNLFPVSWIAISLLCSLIATLIIHYYFIDLFVLVFGGFLRSHEKVKPQRHNYNNNNNNSTIKKLQQLLYNIPGMAWFLLGVIVTIVCFSKTVAVYSLECLSIADPVAAYIGQSFPSRKLTSYNIVKFILPKYCIENSTATRNGSIACFITSWIIGWYILVLPTTNIGIQRNYVTITVAALACTISEAFHYGNDNVSIPLVTAAVVSILV